MPLARLEPEEVFTPRNPEVNERMYIERPALEQALLRAVRGTQHIIIHGESGTGKSWLYKQVFATAKVHFEIANLANANRLGSINKELLNIVERTMEAQETGYIESKSAKASVVVAEGELKHEKSFRLGVREPFENALSKIRSLAGDRRAILVLDNLETIFTSKARMNELADMIILLDDQRYARYKVKLLLVGVPHGVREYFNRTPHRAPVANRLQEIQEVSRLGEKAAQILVYRGFVELLRYAFERDAQQEVARHVSWITDRIPQRLHEYCLELALLALENGRVVSSKLLEVADKRWLQSNLSQAYTAVENAMNERGTKVGRRNQTVYSLGQLTRGEFGLGDVEEVVRGEFPTSTFEKKLNISGMLADLASGKDALLRRSPKGDAYMFTDPLYRMCIRTMLRKRGEEVVKLELTRV